MIVWMKAAACLGIVASLLCVTAARADDWRPVQQSCVSLDGSNGQCGLARSGDILSNVLIAPGGTTAYVASAQIFAGSDNALLIYDRDPATGTLTQRAGKAGCISQDGTSGQCDVGRALGGANGLAISPDGRQLYVQGNGIAVFDRNLATGALLQKPGIDGCITNDGADISGPNVCTNARGMMGPLSDLVLSSDGKTAYVSGQQLAAFGRNATTGVLTQLPGQQGCLAAGAVDGCGNLTGWSHGLQISLSPDLLSLYGAGGITGVTVFDRDPATGALVQKAGKAGCITSNGTGDQCATDARVSGSLAALASPDGHQVYVSTDDGVIVFARAADGRLTFQSCIDDLGDAGCAAGVQMSELTYSAISPDGQDLVVSSEAGGNAESSFFGGIVTLTRDPATGNLTQRRSTDVCVTDDGTGIDGAAVVRDVCQVVPVASGGGRITFAGDSQLYAGGALVSALIAFKRDFYPTCASGAASVAHDTATPVGLVCGDRNGDPLTLQISASPVSGTLGGIDPASRRVTYVPFAGFTGADGFRFKAVAGGLASADATMSLSVAAATVGGGGSGGGVSALVDADHDGFFSGQDCNDHNAAIHPGAREIRGNAVDENCDGLAEALPTLSTGVSTKWNVTGKRFVLSQLQISQPPRGAKLEIRCSGKGCPFTHRALKGKTRRGVLNALPSLDRRVHFLANQTVEVRISATGFNAKVAQLKLRAGHIPTTTPLCLPPGSSRPRRDCG
jgi:hypothetical protein